MILRTENLTSSYGDVTVVRNVSITIRQGDVVAVLGANGAGKSTMVRAITNLHARKSGMVSFDGAGAPSCLCAHVRDGEPPDGRISHGPQDQPRNVE
jgi:branched-chain amino acid transport system ATP-binding protein